MSVHSENGICFLSRLRQKADAIDSEVMNNSDVFVINISENDLNDANAFIHYLCETVFNKYSNLKSNIHSVEESGVQNSPQEEQTNQMLNSSQRSLELFRLSGESSDDSEQPMDVSPDVNPMIIVFDGFDGFNGSQFCDSVKNSNHLKHLAIFVASDASQLLSAINNELPLNIALNPDLKLVIIYAIPHHLCSINAEKIIELMSSLVISVPIVLVVDKISKQQLTDIQSKSMFEILSFKDTGDHQIQIKSKNKTFYRDIPNGCSHNSNNYLSNH